MVKQKNPSKGGRTETVIFRATPETKARLKRLAKHKGLNMSDTLAYLIDSEWKSHNWRQGTLVNK